MITVGMGQYEVYVCGPKNSDNCYVGSGAFNRHKHVVFFDHPLSCRWLFPTKEASLAFEGIIHRRCKKQDHESGSESIYRWDDPYLSEIIDVAHKMQVGVADPRSVKEHQVSAWEGANQASNDLLKETWREICGRVGPLQHTSRNARQKSQMVLELMKVRPDLNYMTGANHRGVAEADRARRYFLSKVDGAWVFDEAKAAKKYPRKNK